MNLKLKRTPGIFLIGFMGSGKSTVGRLLAEEIGWRFADLDDDIEHAQRRTVTEIFQEFGEQEFRRIERAAIQQRVRSIRRGIPTVLSLGGGAFTCDENIALLQENGVTVWIDTDFEIMRRRVQSSDHRPLARNPERFERLYHERRSFYERAEFHVPVHVNDSRIALADVLKLNLLGS
jgi:shikimate kinase